MSATTPSFVHLRAHTEYSVVDSTLGVSDYTQAAARDGQGAAAITDLSNLFGALKFYSACRKRGVKPILGADVRMQEWPGVCGPSRLVLLAQNQQGYNNLCELLSRGWIRGVMNETATLQWDWIGELGDGLIVLGGAADGAVGQLLLSGKAEQAASCARELSRLFPGRFYLEVQRSDREQDEAHVRACANLAADLGLPLVATHPIQFLSPGDHAVHEARVCISQGLMLADPKRAKTFVREQHFKTQEEMKELFADLPSALQNTVLIAQRCNLTLVLGKPQLPDFPTPKLSDGSAMPIADYFRELSAIGLKERMELLYPDPVRREVERPRYEDRLEFEIKTILNMGFPGYFLIVADFIVWAKANKCPVGPGRGSGAGSLVAYSMKITDLDPLAYGLLFERFLNPDRVSMPDFDIDFCQANRDRVIEYVKDKYGREAVSQIATFGTQGAKAALRDAGRVMGMGYGQVDAISKLIPAPPGKHVTLAVVPEKLEEGMVYVRKDVPELMRRAGADEEIGNLLTMASELEGTVRNIGMHAGGVLIAPGKITDFCPLYQQPGSTSAVSQYDKDDVESAGLVKFDFLGLATLTILEIAREFISRRHPAHRDFSYERIPLDDPRVYELFCEGHSEAVFQFESRGMQSLLREAKPDRLEDLIALNALYRPGPMDLVPLFVARKHGREKVEYPHELTEGVLAETYGIMVYQEQVMQVAQILGGYTLGGADLLRRAMGKKKLEEMAKHRSIFREGAARNNIAGPRADEIFDLMEKFAGYGFNKSHAAAYSLLAYQTGYIKVHFAPEFYAANLTVEQGDTDKLKVLMMDAKRFDVTIDPPHINLGTARFEPAGSAQDRRIRYSLAAIKGTGVQAIEAIVSERTANGPFKSLFDFCSRVNRRKVNKRVLEVLIKAGAFDSLHPERSAMMASVTLAMEYADSKTRSPGQGGLFDEVGGGVDKEPDFLKVAPWGNTEKLENERLAIGFFLSGHLIEEHEPELRRFCPRRIDQMTLADKAGTVCGVVVGMKFVEGAYGKSVSITIDDASATMELSLTPELMAENKEWLKLDALIIASGKVSPDRFRGGFRMQAKDVIGLTQARARFADHVLIEVDRNESGMRTLMQSLRALGRANEAAAKSVSARGAAPARDWLPIQLSFSKDNSRADIVLNKYMACDPSEAGLAQWRKMASRVSVVYGSATFLASLQAGA